GGGRGGSEGTATAIPGAQVVSQGVEMELEGGPGAGGRPRRAQAASLALSGGPNNRGSSLGDPAGAAAVAAAAMSAEAAKSEAEFEVLASSLKRKGAEEKAKLVAGVMSTST
ncbi:unnamed protein product, partial [Discosporangium mesarthrocarpum]